MIFRYSTFWRRFFAGVIDGFVCAPLDWLHGAFTDEPTRPDARFAWSLLIGFGPIIYSILMHWRWGQTLGKMATGVVVLDVSETRYMRLRQSCLRDIGVIVPQACAAAFELVSCFVDLGAAPLHAAGVVLGSAMAIWFLLEVVTMLTNDKRRALHDWIAGSVVVRTDQVSA